jgi:poly(3-hydroxybutyrate) depolymerase
MPSSDLLSRFLRPGPRPLLLRLAFTAGLLGAGPVAALAQQSLALSQLQLRYRVLQRATQLDATKTAELRRLEQAALAARSRGEHGLAFRDLSQAVALLEGKPWAGPDEFLHSLALVTDTTVCDPTRPLVARLTQIFPAARGELAFTVKVALEPLAAGRPAARRTRSTGRPLGEFASLPADLIFTPFRFQADLADVSDGAYQLTAELHHADKSLHRITTPIFVVRGMDSARAALEPRLRKIAGHDEVKASIRYPFDFARVLNLGQTDPMPYDFSAGLARSEELLASLEAGRDPFAGERGNLARHYAFADAGEIMPYRVYVPKTYDGTRAMPLIIALHGLGGTETTFMQQGEGALPRLAEERGFLVATPLGYRRNGGYGRTAISAIPQIDPLTVRMTQLSEADVLNVLQLVRTHYRVDATRIYLMGHSMGANGTWTLGSRHAHLWAALGPIAGGGTGPSAVPLAKLKEHRVPVFCVHGDADRTAPVEASRAMVAELKKLGVEHEYLEVAGGSHGSVVGPNLPRIVDFFLRHQRTAP